MDPVRSNQRQWVITRRPWLLWTVCAGFVIAGLIALFNGEVVIALCLWVPSVLPLLISEIATCILDQDDGLVTLKRRSLWRSVVREIPFAEILAVTVEQSYDSDNGTTYRVVFMLRSGERVPFSSYYSSDQKYKRKLAQQLADFIGAARGQPVQAALDGVVSSAWTGTTEDVPWQIDCIADQEVAPTLRWFTAVTRLPGHFLLLVPVATTGKSASIPVKGILASAARLMYRQYFKLLSFDAQEVPGLDQAVTLNELDERLKRHFVALTSDPAAAWGWLNVDMAELLADWVARHPPKTGKATNLLGVLVSPRGLWLSFRADRRTEGQVEEVAQLGAALVHAQQL